MPEKERTALGTYLGQLGAQSEVRLEQDGSVNADEVAARHLLVELKKDAEREAVEQLVLAHLQHVRELDGRAGSLLERELDTGDLGLDLHGVLGQAAEGGDDGAGLVAAVLQDEPSGGLGEEVDGSDQDKREEDGDGDRWAPCLGPGLEFKEAQVNP